MRTTYSEVSSFGLIGRVCAIAPALDKKTLYQISNNLSWPFESFFHNTVPAVLF